MKPLTILRAVLLCLASILQARSELLVSSYSSNLVFRYNETNGAFIDIFVPNTNGLLSLPHGLAFGPDNNLYVASAGNDSVLRYNGSTGEFIDAFVASGSGGLDYPVALLFRGGFLYVSSQLNDRVLRFNATNGAFVDVFVTNNPALVGPSDMVFGPDGNLYITGRFNDTVCRYNGSTGALMDVFVSNNLAQPFGLRFDGSGRLLVVSGNDNRVQQFDESTGTFLGTFTSAGGLGLPIGIVVGPDGNVYVASFGNGKVAKYSVADGTYLGDFVAPGSGGLGGPNFLMFRPDGSVPGLAIALTEAAVWIGWQQSAQDVDLEQAAGSALGSWTLVTNEWQTTDGSNVVILPRESGARLFRLRKLQ